jgi:hypothetical protein
MNTKGNLALAVLAGISIGAVSVMAVHAQEAKTPPAYLIAETEVTDRAPFRTTQKRFRKRWRLSGAVSTMSSVAARLRLSRANRRRASWCSRQHRESSCLV